MSEFWPTGSVDLVLKDSTTGREAHVDSDEVVVNFDYSQVPDFVRITIEADFLGAFRGPETAQIPEMPQIGSA